MRICLFVVVLILSSCTATQSTVAFDPAQPINTVRTENDCYDAAIILPRSLVETKAAIVDVTENLNAEILKDTDNQYTIKRRHHTGRVISSGGEIIHFNLTRLGADKTYLTINTTRDNINTAGQRAWSCELANNLRNSLE